jgi:hypothetical protein
MARGQIVPKQSNLNAIYNFIKEKFHNFPQPGLLPEEKEKRTPHLWPNQRRDWPVGLPMTPHRAFSHLLPIRCGEGIILRDDFLG